MSSLTFISFSNTEPATQISGGGLHVCAVFSSSSIRCWGSGANGALGQGSTKNIGALPGEMESLPFIEIGLRVAEVTPVTLFSGGGELITVTGSSFPLSLSVVLSSSVGGCLVIVPSGSVTVVNSTLITLTTPVWPCATGAATLVVNSTSASSPKRTYFFGGHDITRVEPVAASIGVLVPQLTLHGSGFALVPGLFCKIGLSSYAAVVKSSTLMVCNNVTVAASSTNIPFSVGGLQASAASPVGFRSFALSSFDVDAAAGLETGGLLLTLHLQGSGLAPGLEPLVKFTLSETVVLTAIGDLVADPASPSGFSARCTTPDISLRRLSLPLSANLSLSLNNGASWEPLVAAFEYQAVPRVLTVSPPAAPLNSVATINFDGSNFISRSGSIAVFRTTESSNVTSISVVCMSNGSLAVTAAFPIVGRFQADVSFSGGKQYSQGGPTISVFSITSINPSGGPITGASNVVVTGTGFVFSSDFVCRFGSIATVPALFQSSATVLCASPASPSALAPAVVDISVDGAAFTNSLADSPGARFIYHALPVVTAVRPVAGPASLSASSVTATLWGSFTVLPGAFASSTPRCSFGTSISVMVTLKSTVITCSIPPSRVPGSLPIAVALNGVDYTAVDQSFSYFSLISVSPNLGPTTGMTHVTVSGSGFTALSSWFCRFALTNSSNSTTTQARYLSAGQLVCPSPAADRFGSQAFSVEVSSDGTQFSSSANATVFRLYAPPAVASLRPASGSTVGGTAVVVEGALVAEQSLGGAAVCRFGGLGDVKATTLSINALTCVAPPGLGSVAVQISLNGGSDFHPTPISSAPVFSYFSVDSILPLLGPASGQSAVTIAGSGFTPALFSMTLCQFGTTTVKASLRIDNQRIVCLSPQQSLSSARARALTILQSGGLSRATVANSLVPVRVSTNNGADWVASSSSSFLFFPAPAVTSFSPLSAPADGGTIIVLWITFAASALPSSAILLCTFGSGSSGVGATLYFTPGSAQPATAVCQPSPSALGQVRLGFTLNGVIQDASLAPTLLSLFRVQELIPPNSPFVFTGSLRVVLVGEGFVLGERYMCLPGNSTAEFVSSLKIACSFDAFAPPRINVTIDGGSSVTASPPLQLYSPPTASFVVPSSLPTAGGRLTLYGSMFAPATAYCRVGNASAAVPADAGTSNITMLVCVHPAAARVSNATLFVSNNNQQFHNTSLLFSLTSCPPGFLETATSACQPCRRGEFSSEFGSQTCFPCPSGNYSDGEGRSYCKACPAGTESGGQRDSLLTCTCQERFYSPTGAAGTACSSCPAGATCAGGVSPPRSLPDFWPSTGFTFLACSPGACKGGFSLDDYEARQGGCGSGRTGRKCAVCLHGYYLLQTKECVKCPEGARFIFLIFVLLAFLVATLLIRSKRARAYGAIVGIFVNYLQTLFIVVNSMSGAHWPPVIKNFTMALNFLFRGVDALAPECTIPNFSFSVRWGITLLIPMFVLVIFAVVFSGAVLTQRLSKNPRSTGSLLDASVNSYITVLTWLYLTILAAAISPFACSADRDGRQALIADPSIFCGGTDAKGKALNLPWRRMLPAYIVGALVYVIAVPALLSWWLRVNMPFLGLLSFEVRWGVLYINFKRDRAYWASVEVVEKIAIAAIGTLLSRTISLQIALMLGVFVAFFGINLLARPFCHDGDNTFQSILRACNIAVLMSAVIFTIDSNSGSQFTTAVTVFAVLVISTGCVVLGVTSIGFLRNLIARGRVPLRGEVSRVLLSPEGEGEFVDWLATSPTDPKFPDKVLDITLEAVQLLEGILPSGDKTPSGHHCDFEQLAIMRSFTRGIFRESHLPYLVHWLVHQSSQPQRASFVRCFSIFGRYMEPEREILSTPAEALASRKLRKERLALLQLLYDEVLACLASPTGDIDREWIEHLHGLFLHSGTASAQELAMRLAPPADPGPHPNLPPSALLLSSPRSLPPLSAARAPPRRNRRVPPSATAPDNLVALMPPLRLQAAESLFNDLAGVDGLLDIARALGSDATWHFARDSDCDGKLTKDEFIEVECVDFVSSDCGAEVLLHPSERRTLKDRFDTGVGVVDDDQVLRQVPGPLKLHFGTLLENAATRAAAGKRTWKAFLSEYARVFLALRPYRGDDQHDLVRRGEEILGTMIDH